MALAIKKFAAVLILLPGTATAKLKKDLKKVGFKNENIIAAGSMLKAVRAARNLIQKNDFVVLSPGAASFGLFNNEFERGEKFVVSVNRIFV